MFGPSLVPPEVLEPRRRQLGVTDGVLDVAVAEISLQRPRVVRSYLRSLASGSQESRKLFTERFLGLTEVLRRPVETTGVKRAWCSANFMSTRPSQVSVRQMSGGLLWAIGGCSIECDAFHISRKPTGLSSRLTISHWGSDAKIRSPLLRSHCAGGRWRRAAGPSALETRIRRLAVSRMVRAPAGP